MLVKSIKLQNFKVFDNAKLDFDNGIGVLIGENGNGKSSIFEAIEFSLFGTIVRKGRKFGSSYATLTDLIQTKRSAMSAELIFNSPVNKKDYKILRNIDKSGKRNDALFLGQAIVCKGANPVNNEVIKLLGLNQEAFSAISYVRQGEISELTSKTPGEREKIIDRILNLEVFEKAREIVNKDKNDVKRQQEGIQSKIEQIGQDVSEDKTKLEEQKKDLDAAVKNFSKIDKKYRELKKEKATLEKLKNLQTKIDGYDKTLESEGKKKEHAIGRKQEEIKGHQAELKHKIDSLKRDANNRKELSKEKIESLKSKREAEIEKAKYHMPVGIMIALVIVLVITGLTLIFNAVLALVFFVMGAVFLVSRIKSSKSSQPSIAGIHKKYDAMIRSEERESDSEIKSLEKKIGSLENELEVKGKEHGKDLEHITEEEIRNIGRMKEEIEKMRLEEKKLKDKIKSEDVENDFEEAEQKREELLNSKKELDGAIKTLKRKLDGYKANLSMLEKDNEGYERRLEELNILSEEIFKRIPKWIRLRLISVVRSETKNLFLKMFGHRYKDIQITSDYNIEVLSPFANEFYPVSMISGGEETAANIALRLGISKALHSVYGEVRSQKSAPGLLVMDEPTTHLDRRRREILNEVIKAIRGLPQVLISTNIEEVENAADYIISVTRESSMGSSKIATFKPGMGAREVLV